LTAFDIQQTTFVKLAINMMQTDYNLLMTTVYSTPVSVGPICTENTSYEKDS